MIINIMDEKMFFTYLIGKWFIERKISNNLSLPFSASAVGKVSITKRDQNTLDYQESVKVKWGNGLISNAHKRYCYILNDNGDLGLYNLESDKVSFMFNLVFDLQLKNIAKGQYQCGKDSYSATYKIINCNEFTLEFLVNGSEKAYTITSHFFRI